MEAAVWHGEPSSAVNPSWRMRLGQSRARGLATRQCAHCFLRPSLRLAPTTVEQPQSETSLQRRAAACCHPARVSRGAAPRSKSISKHHTVLVRRKACKQWARDAIPGRPLSSARSVHATAAPQLREAAGCGRGRSAPDFWHPYPRRAPVAGARTPCGLAAPRSAAAWNHPALVRRGAARRGRVSDLKAANDAKQVQAPRPLVRSAGQRCGELAASACRCDRSVKPGDSGVALELTLFSDATSPPCSSSRRATSVWPPVTPQ
jgi:hypothetical protein